MGKEAEITRSFATPFLKDFILVPETIPFESEELSKLDEELSHYERVGLNPDIEKSLLTKNEVLVSFAISKAENSNLTIEEAEEVYGLIKKSPDFNFIKDKLEGKEKLTRKDYEKLEFFNIAKTFKALNQENISLEKIDSEKIREIHKSLTSGLDIFKNYLPDFTVYKSGEWRAGDDIRVGEYVPAPHELIENEVKGLLDYVKKEKSILSLAAFHTALYAVHPFNNGNKRVCRVLEHIMLRQLGLNKNNLYSTSYYYHKEKDRYYKYLLASLQRKNLNYFSSFAMESLALSIISVVKTSIEVERSDFLKKQDIEESMLKSFSPLIKRREIQFKNIFKENKKRVSRQTLINHLNKGVDLKILSKREEGRNTYYGINISLPEEETYKKWIVFARERLSYVPDDILLA
ncbi:MAG: Fic family protein [Candidatus Pacebacteria bacterium]|nr:Fic family protein [Candidatus Paceibacterota bacterium]